MGLALRLAGLALLASPAISKGPPVLSETLTGGVYTLEGGFTAQASRDVAWQVLTDFSGLPRFVPSVRSSALGADVDGGLLVTQDFEGKVLFITRDLHVRLSVAEQPETAIAFHDVSAQDFVRYEGDWSLDQSSAGAKVSYRLRAQPRTDVPGLVGRAAFKDGALKMLAELRTEMERRAAIPPTPIQESRTP